MWHSDNFAENVELGRFLGLTDEQLIDYARRAREYELSVYGMSLIPPALEADEETVSRAAADGDCRR